jgi:tetratricopeptide (TPR) repeat protein
MPNAPLPTPYEGGGVQRIQPYDDSESPSFLKKHGIRMILGGVAGLIFLLALTPSAKKPKVQETTSQSVDTVVTFDKLTPENKAAVVDTYNLVRNLIRSGKYELCIQELLKLHSMVPFYEDSRELVQECKNATQLAQQKADYDYRQQEKLRRAREIDTITSECQDKINRNPNISPDELKACLSHAIELDPENAKIIELTNFLKVREQERQDRQRASAEHRARVREAEAQYHMAVQKAKSGRLHEAVGEYEKFLSANYPSDIAPLKQKARREVASVQKQLSNKVGRLLAKCHDNLDKAHYRTAYEACAAATGEDPSNNQAQDLAKQSLSELRREMKAVYEDSVLEESLGNIDSAKEKWKHLMQDDLPTDEYFTKAKLKLQKYGVGI